MARRAPAGRGRSRPVGPRRTAEVGAPTNPPITRSNPPPLVVGAGPVGLAAALFCHAHGRPVRLIDMRDVPTHRSKALAVNPRTLELLEPSGVTQRMLEIGRPIGGAQVHFGPNRVHDVPFAGVHPRYPFMLALSQAVTERLITRRLEEFGGRVERGSELRRCALGEHGVEATLRVERDDEVAVCPWLLAADGAHSTTRAACGIEFPGSELAREWHLADVPLRTTLADDRAHVFFVDRETFVFALPVVDDTSEASAPIWRVISNRPNPSDRIPSASVAGPASWSSSFRIAHRVATDFARDRVYLAGDAAHVHSPLGARGMNLGIEDAWVFAELASRDRLDAYATCRRRIDAAVVRRVERLTEIADAATPWRRLVRGLASVAVLVPFARSAMRRTVTGLDHVLSVPGAT